MNRNNRRLPDAELEVMQAIWANEAPVARNNIEAALKDNHPMALTTLLTLLSRLAKKEFIIIEKHGRNSFYIPLISEKEYIKNQSRQFFDQLCRKDIRSFATALCEDTLTKEELEELRRLLKEDSL